jgi:hypothetical protein
MPCGRWVLHLKLEPKLFKLNQERAKAESKAAAQVKVKGKKNGK